MTRCSRALAVRNQPLMSALFHHDLVALRCLSCFFFQINIYELRFAISSLDGEKKRGMMITLGVNPMNSVGGKKISKLGQG